MIQVYKVLDKIRDRLRDNPSVFKVTFGDITEVDLNKTTIFPLAHLTLGNAVFENNVINFTIQLLCLDIVDYNKKGSDFDDFYGNDNLQDIYNTQIHVVNDIIQAARRGTLFDNKIQLLGTPSATPFKDRYENDLAGWGVEIEFSIPNEINIC